MRKHKSPSAIDVRVSRIVSVVLVVGTVACGGGDSPTSPTRPPTATTTPTPTPTPTRIIELAGNLNFGDVAIGQTKTSTLTIRNSGNSPLTFTGFSASPSECTSVFFVDPTTGTASPNASTAVTISFKPTSVRSWACTIAVATDSTAGANSLAMSGAGVSASSAGTPTFYLWGGSDYSVYLGNFSCTFCKEFGSESINNEFGTYGSRFSASSIRNQFGTYGSQFSSLSPCNQFASTPPRVFNANKTTYYGALTINRFASGYIADLHAWLTGDVCNH